MTANVIETTCPLSMEKLKEFFQDKENTVFQIDYRGGSLDADALMVYLSNLNLNADFDQATYDDRDALKELVLAYMKTTASLLDVPQLAREALAICCQHRNVVGYVGNDPVTYFELLGDASDFISENTDVVERWCVMLDSSGVYNLHCANDPEFNKFIEETFPTIDDPDYVGINYVFCYNNPWIGVYIGSIGDVGNRPAAYFPNQFNEYRFKGDNMFKYFNVEHNVLAVMSQVIASGEWENIELET